MPGGLLLPSSIFGIRHSKTLRFNTDALSDGRWVQLVFRWTTADIGGDGRGNQWHGMHSIAVAGAVQGRVADGGKHSRVMSASTKILPIPSQVSDQWDAERFTAMLVQPPPWRAQFCFLVFGWFFILGALGSRVAFTTTHLNP